MTPDGRARVLACFENMIEISPACHVRQKDKGSPSAQSKCLPQMPQLPQQQVPVRKPLTDREDAFEERAAIIEYDGGLPRSLAEFLARRCDGRGGTATSGAREPVTFALPPVWDCCRNP